VGLFGKLLNPRPKIQKNGRVLILLIQVAPFAGIRVDVEETGCLEGHAGFDPCRRIWALDPGLIPQLAYVPLSGGYPLQLLPDTGVPNEILVLLGARIHLTGHSFTQPAVVKSLTGSAADYLPLATRV